MTQRETMLVVGGEFEAHWPFVVDELSRIAGSWDKPCRVIRLPREDQRKLGQVVGDASRATRLICLDVSVGDDCLAALSLLEEAVFLRAYGGCYLSQAQQESLRQRGVQLYAHTSEGFWGQSVAEFALGLTLCALRQIPQNHHALCEGDDEAWARYLPARNLGPGTLGAQYSDDGRFTNGTISGKRVRIVGAGNIGSRYAHFVHALGADVAAWDPYAPEPAFHRSGARREWHLDQLVSDAEIFAPMLPLTEATRGLVHEGLLRSLPNGCLVVLATRAGIVDMSVLRERVMAEELALAADVFDVEPLPNDDPLLRRSNVVHTPHLAGRTSDANVQWAHDLARQFLPRQGAYGEVV